MGRHPSTVLAGGFPQALLSLEAVPSLPCLLRVVFFPSFLPSFRPSSLPSLLHWWAMSCYSGPGGLLVPSPGPQRACMYHTGPGVSCGTGLSQPLREPLFLGSGSASAPGSRKLRATLHRGWVARLPSAPPSPWRNDSAQALGSDWLC